MQEKHLYSISQLYFKILTLHSLKAYIFTDYLLTSKPYARHKELQGNEVEYEKGFDKVGVVRC